MMTEMPPSPSETLRRVERAAQGDQQALGELLEQYRDRLRRMVVLRLDPRLQSRVDPSDVIQEGYIDASRRLEEYARDQSAPFYIWLRFLVGQRILDLHRRHLGAQIREVGREVSLYRGPMPEASTAALAAQLLGKLTSPSQAAVRAERKIRLQEALNAMDPIDREIIILRHYEQMSNGEAAMVLNLDKSAASKRYTRALIRLKEILGDLSGGDLGGRP
jgi:RNA polymerase sigma-70 factor (ECF subfamily)